MTTTKSALVLSLLLHSAIANTPCFDNVQFGRFDFNNNGYLTRGAFSKWFRVQFGTQPEFVDVDEEAVVEVADPHAGHDHKKRQMDDEWLHMRCLSEGDMWQAVDVNKDNIVELHEFASFLPTVNKLRFACNVQSNSFFDTLDADHDHLLSIDELQAYYQALIDAADAATMTEVYDPHAGHNHKRALKPICLSGEQLISSFDVDDDQHLARFEFGAASSHLLLIAAKQCVLVLPPVEPTQPCIDEEAAARYLSEKWLYGILASVAVSLLALVGLFLIPFQDRAFREKVLTPLLSFAVGTLLGDAILHLIPNVLGVHSHDAVPDTTPYYLYCLVILLGVVAFFLLERHIEHLHGPDDHHHHHHAHSTSLAGCHNPGHSHGQLGANDDDAMRSAGASDDEEKLVHANSNTGGGGSGGDAANGKPSEIMTVGWLNLASDLIHNFVDGVAIGASFSVSVTVGVATTVAVLCHELPQELADFSILIHAGFSKKRALLLNFATACTAIVGTLIGLGIGTNSTRASRWLLAFTAGNFLYIALADMVQTLHSDRRVSASFVQVIGIALGIAIMVGITFLEEALYVSPDCNAADAHEGHNH